MRSRASSAAGSPSSLSDSAYRFALDVESGDRVVVGVNRYQTEPEPIDVFEVDPEMEAGQVAAVRAVRERRDQHAVDAALADLRAAASAGTNVLEPTVTAVKAYATVGEVVAVLREVHGSWVRSSAF